MRKVMAVVMALGLVIGLTGCGEGYDVPEFKTLEPSQTGFLIPLEGQTSEQKEFGSEKFLNKAKKQSGGFRFRTR
jgi:hypothetical protein